MRCLLCIAAVCRPTSPPAMTLYLCAVSGCDETLTGMNSVGAVVGFAVRVPTPPSPSSNSWSVVRVSMPLSRSDISTTFSLGGYVLGFFADNGATVATASATAPYTGYPLPGALVRGEEGRGCANPHVDPPTPVLLRSSHWLRLTPRLPLSRARRPGSLSTYLPTAAAAATARSCPRHRTCGSPCCPTRRSRWSCPW